MARANKIESTQPYAAFAAGFGKAGVDSTDINIARENLEVCERAARWLPLWSIKPFCKGAIERRKDVYFRECKCAPRWVPPFILRLFCAVKPPKRDVRQQADQDCITPARQARASEAVSAQQSGDSNERLSKVINQMITPASEAQASEAVSAQQSGNSDERVSKAASEVEASEAASAQKSGNSDNLVSKFFNKMVDLSQLLFRGLLYFLADHGYRPGKVLRFVSGTVIMFWLIFLLHLRVVAYTSSAGSEDAGPFVNKNKLRPIGLIFVIDRLMPGYWISETHYKIREFYKIKRVSNIEPAIRRLLFIKLSVVPVTDQVELARIERTLNFLRIIGMIYAVFLAAAISSLFVH